MNIEFPKRTKSGFDLEKIIAKYSRIFDDSDEIIEKENSVVENILEEAKQTKKYGFANYSQLPIDPIHKRLDFRYGDYFQRSKNIESLFPLQYKVDIKDAPTEGERSILEAIPTGYTNSKNIYAFVQFSKAGKSFAIREFSKRGRWVLLSDFAINGGDELKRASTNKFWNECRQMCKIRDDLKSNSNINSHYQIDKDCYNSCQHLSKCILYSHLIHLLIYLNNNNVKNKDCFDYFKISQSVVHQEAISKIFDSIKLHNLYDVGTMVRDAIHSNEYLRNNAPIMAIDECGVLMDKKYDYFQHLDHAKQDG